MSNTYLGQQGDFRTLFNQVDRIALWTVTEPGSFDYISDGFEDIWGIPPEKILNDIDRLIETIHPEDRDRVRANIGASKTSAQHSSDNSYEGRVVRPDGSVRWVQTRQVLIWDDDGEIEEVVGISTDITEQKQREEELELLNRIIRHDIRNDMTVMLGWAELLKEDVDEGREENLQKILTSGKHVVELTEIARDYVEAVVSNDDISVESVPVASILETELSLREESFPDAEFVLDDSLPDVEVTANEMLSSVFRNLLNNAVQHNDKETPVVEVSARLRDDIVEVRIADNGSGVPDKHKDVIFGKGEKGLGSPGTGIGLYLVQTLVAQYGGNVWVEDNDPTGAVFVVQLPKATE